MQQHVIITCKVDCQSSIETTGYFEICTFYSTEKNKKQKHSIEGWLYSIYNMIRHTKSRKKCLIILVAADSIKIGEFPALIYFCFVVLTGGISCRSEGLFHCKEIWELRDLLTLGKYSFLKYA